MRHTEQLAALIHAPDLLIMPTAYDAISAKLVEQAGFQALQISGMAVAASRYGMPDLGIVAMQEMVDATRVITHAVDIPVMADADTGYGTAVNVWYATRAFEDAGAAGMNLEDQIAPKRCGRLDGKAVIRLEEMVGKIEAAADARRDNAFVINARTDALGLHGLDEVIRRGNAYLRAGATMVFVPGVTRIKDVQRLVRAMDGPVALNLIEADAPQAQALDFDTLQRLGVARVSLTMTTLLGAMRGVTRALQNVKRQRCANFDADMHVPFDDVHTLMGVPQAMSIADRYIPSSP